MKALRIAWRVLAVTLVLALALLGGLWLWGAGNGSLATALAQAAAYLPPGQTLEVKAVSGTLREGGRIGWLRWQQGEFSVEAQDVEIQWTLRALLDGQLRLSQLAVRHLQIDDRRPASAPTPLTELRWPLAVDAPFSVAALAWNSASAPVITELTGHYIFNSKEHILDKAKAHISSGIYQISARLQAQAPMALTVQLDGSVETTVPASGRSIRLQAQAGLQGQLAGRDAALTLQAWLRPTDNPDAQHAMQADITAQLQPWHAQPVASANAHWQALDLAALWPQAPQTRLAGQAAITPAGADWHAALQLTNTLSGPWNQHRLPLEQLTARIVYQQAQWTVSSLQARGAGGQLEAHGGLTPAQSTSAARWHGSATLHGINPGALDTRLAPTVLDGQVTAPQDASGLAFDAQLQPAKRRAAASQAPSSRLLDGLRVNNVQAQGVWLAPLLTLASLRVQTDEAQLQGALSFHTLSQATAGQLALTLPGASASVAGHISSSQGNGEWRLSATDAALASRWLTRWPGLAAPLGQLSLQGKAELNGQWQGGWQHQGQGLQLQASLRAPQLDLSSAGQAPPDQAWRLRDLQADLAGALGALKLTARLQAEQASRHFELQAQAQGGRLPDGNWRVQLDTAQLTAQDSLRPGLWSLQLNERLLLNWTHSASGQTLSASPGSARLSGPTPASATVSWLPARWAQPVATRAGPVPAHWQTQGRLQGLPLAWLELLGQTQLSNLGLRGDLLFDGQWEAAGDDHLRLRASLQRSSGDLQLQTEEAGSVRAGVREAGLLISADGDRIEASLRWDSERAGQAQASVRTRLQRQGGRWTWPADAPLAGTVHTQLPSVGAWSLLAPPGWRLRGTLDADAVLSGTRSAPQWTGSLRAQDMALRSVADGLDFSQGTLRANLKGERLDITEFTLQGAGGSKGGLLSITGFAQWLTPSAPTATAASRLHMALTAQLQGLRVSSRADRRLALSGQLTAQLKEARLVLRGALKADQALFILPEDSAPQLGDDVHVRSPRDSQAPATPAPAAKALRVTPDVLVTLDFGSDFEVRGRGLLTRLAGNLELRSAPERESAPRLLGELHTVRGSYKAYGQQLDIEEGVLRFSGPYDNPALDILALRPNLPQRVGVQISGTARSPLVRLYAEPELPDADKLAWLVLGRSAANGGAEAAVLQQAALALLGGKGQSLSGSLAQALGLDELSMRGGASGADGSATAASVTLGKRVSRNFYVAYERSLAGTLGTFYIFYDLSRRFTLRAQTGEQSAIDLIFTVRYD
jgi:translocation and assembly module TamB